MEVGIESYSTLSLSAVGGSVLRWRLSAAVALSITRAGPDVEAPNASAVSD